MELVELLDKIDESAPISCKTCKFMASHNSLCRTCLHDPGQPTQTPFKYYNHKPGNWLRELQRAEMAGEINIVVGDVGEADFCALNSPQAVSKHLHYVAEQCGYMCSNLRKKNGQTLLEIYTQEGRFLIEWENGTLKEIVELKADGSTLKGFWPRF